MTMGIRSARRDGAGGGDDAGEPPHAAGAVRNRRLRDRIAGGCGCGRTLPTIERVIGRRPQPVPPCRWPAALAMEFRRGAAPAAGFGNSRSCRKRSIATRSTSPRTRRSRADPTGDSRRFRTDPLRRCHRDFEQVAEVPRTSGGKFMIAISRLADHVRLPRALNASAFSARPLMIFSTKLAR